MINRQFLVLVGLEYMYEAHTGGLKTQDWKSQDWKTWDQIAVVEKTGLENTGPNFQRWKRRDWKTREHHVHG